MRARIGWMLASALTGTVLLPCAAQVPGSVAQAPATTAPAEAPRERTSVYIRRMAGLAPETADGNIEIVDVGHLPLDTMISLVARKSPQGWRVSYACAESPHCVPGQSVDHASLDYSLSPDAAAKLDAALDALAKSDEPESPPPTPGFIACGRLVVWIDLPGLKRDYRRVCRWGEKLGAIEQIISPTHSL